MIRNLKNILIFFTLTLQGISQTTMSYDSTLAKKLGADPYGMKKYVLVILKTGTNTTEHKEKLDSLFAGHFSNMDRMVKEGQLIMAGPIAKNEKTYRGIFILNVSTIEEAKKIVETDPTVRAKVLEAELYEWYGSAALPVYMDTHKKIQKSKI